MTKIGRYVPVTAVSYVPMDAGAAAKTKVEDKAAMKVSVSTVAATAVATGHLALKVEGYSRLKAMHGDNGSYIESSSVEIGGHTWKIRCYLDASTKEYAGCLSVYLYLCSDSDSVVHDEYELALVRQNGPWPEHGPKCALIKTSMGLRTFGGKDNKCGSGHPWFVKGLGQFGTYGYPKDDCFTIRCTVTVVEERTAMEEVVVPADHMAKLMGMLCKCDDHRCRREHARPSGLEIIAKFFRSICCGRV